MENRASLMKTKLVVGRSKLKLVVNGAKFDSVLSQLLKMKPIPMKNLKTRGRKGSKAPIIAPKK